ncbi:MAG: hypothetical protein ACOYD6_00110 [Limnochordia bacterium]
MRQVVAIALTYIGSVVGAGFASGQEILQFFARFGPLGLWGVLLSTIGFAWAGGKLLFIAKEIEAQSYQEVIVYLCGPRLGALYDPLITFFLFGGFSIMLAGGGEALAMLLPISPLGGVLLMTLCTAIILKWGAVGLLKLNLYLVPPLVLGTLILFLLSLVRPVMAGVGGLLPHWWGSAILYVSYNMILATAVLASLGPQLTSSRQGLWAGIAGGLGLGAILAANCYTLYQGPLTGDLPLLEAAIRGGLLFQYSYSLVLWMAMITTAVANGYALLARLQPLAGPRGDWLFLFLCLAALPWTLLGFAQLIGFLYPLYGYLGLILFPLLLAKT